MAKSCAEDSFEESGVYTWDFSPLEWRLHYLYQHLRIIWQLTRFSDQTAPRINSAEATDAQHFEHAITTLPAILGAIKFQDAAESLVLESDLYDFLLELVVEIAGEDYGRNNELYKEIVRILVEAFEELMKLGQAGEQWENPTSSDDGVIRCSNNLIKLCRIVERPHNDPVPDTRVPKPTDDKNQSEESMKLVSFSLLHSRL